MAKAAVHVSGWIFSWLALVSPTTVFRLARAVNLLSRASQAEDAHYLIVGVFFASVFASPLSALLC